MILYKTPTYYLLVFILVVAIFSFKINLISIGGSGIRVDDLLIFLLLAVILANLKKTFVPINNKPIFLTLILVIFSFFSVYINSQLYSLPLLTGVMYSIRILEYMLFFYVGYYLANTKFSLNNFVKFYIIYAFVLIILQTLHIIPVVSGFSVGRAIANTGGPWELAVVISFMVFYSYKEIQNKLFFYLSFLILFLTQSRVTTFAVLFILFFTYLKKLTFKKILILVAIGLIGILILLFSNIELIDRYLDILNMKTFESLLEIISRFEYGIDREYYIDMTYGENLSNILSMDGDSSALIRFTRWTILLGMTLSTDLSIFIGIGPSFAGAAVDGNYVRLFIETGLIGLFLFLYIIYSIYKSTKYDFIMRSYLITIIITAIFIDIYTTYKAMVLLWFYYGYLLRKKRNENIILRKI